MTPQTRWETVHLTQGVNTIARVRVPVADDLPRVILWGARYFVRSDSSYGLYHEGTCYMVPLEHMHSGERPAPIEPTRKVKS